jgi:aminopeptidase N
MVWSKTASGVPWIAVALQGEGADLLFPCKDHPSDRPAQAWMRVTVPDPLVAVGPGKLESVKQNPDKTSTYNWHMSMPIANYSIVFNAAPYKLVEASAKSVTGQDVPIQFYVLPEDAAKAPQLIGEVKKYLAFMEKYCGPYPFRTEKLGIVETPHLGMEHSTAIAYGNKFRFNSDGADWLMLHEFGHEWWANLVTASDWKDFWIHEGFQTYMDTLYQEETNGRAAYLAAMKGKVRGTQNKIAVAPLTATASDQIYGGDIYDKGALVLHALRFLIGDKAFFASIRHMAYPSKESEGWTDGRAERLVTTNDFINIVNKETGKDFRWFFDVYVRQPKLPQLEATVTGKTLNLKWIVPDGLIFPMPVDVLVDGVSKRIPMTGGTGSVSFTGNPPVVDPDGWVLKAS